MQLLKVLAGPLFVLVVFIAITVLGVVTSGAGWIAISLLCAWPALWAVTAWTVKGLKITVAPTGSAARQSQQRTREVLG